MRHSAILSAGLFLFTLTAGPQARPQGAQAPSQPAGAQEGAGQPAAQTPQAPGQTPERTDQGPIRTGINYVRVDVIVTDNKGNPVLDLKPEDFSLAEDGKPQKIESFSVVKIDTASQVDAPPAPEIRTPHDEEEEAQRPDVRLFILLLDDYHVRRGNDMTVRKPLTDFIENQLAPQDMVAIMYPLTPVNNLQFTRNHKELVSAIEHFQGRKFNYTPQNPFEEQYAYYPASTVEQIRNEVTMGALRGAAVKLGSMREGRKSILFVSEGFTSTLPPQLNDPIAAMPRVGNPASGNPFATGANDSVQFFNEASLMSDLREVFNAANRQNTSIYAVDPRGLTAFEYDVNEGVGMTTDRKQLNQTMDTLRVLADNTDGRAILNRNDLAVGMKQIIRDSSGYYLLGYNSSQAPTDGRFHEIKVKVARKGLDVRARKGYWAYTAEDAARALAPEAPKVADDITEALNAMAEPPRGRAARFWIGTAQGTSGRSQVTFAWEPVTGTAAPRDPANAAARVLLTATAPDGRPLFRGRIPEEAAVVVQAPNGAAAAPHAGALKSFDAPPGQVQLRMVVENADGQVIDSATQDVTVPDFTQVQVSLSTPRVYRARTVREVQEIKRDPAAPPTADRSFSRTERMVVRVQGYAPGGETPTLSAQLLNREGKPMAEVPVEAASGQGVVDLGLSSLAAGDYLLELDAKSAAGSSSREIVAFRVGR